MIACPTCGRADHRRSPDYDLAHLYRHTSAQALAQARAEGFRLCQEMAAAAIIDASGMNGQVYAMQAAAMVRALKVEGE